MRDPPMPTTTASAARPHNPFRRGHRTNLRYADARYQQRTRRGNKTAVTTIVFGVILCAVTFVSLLQNGPRPSSSEATNVLYLRNSNEETTIPIVTTTDPIEGNELGTAGVDSNMGQKESFLPDAREHEDDDHHKHLTTSRENDDDQTKEADGGDSTDRVIGDDATSHEDEHNVVTDDVQSEDVANASLQEVKSETSSPAMETHGTDEVNQNEVIEEMVADESVIVKDATNEDLQLAAAVSNEHIVESSEHDQGDPVREDQVSDEAEDSSSTLNDATEEGRENSAQPQSIFDALPSSAKEKLLKDAIDAVAPIDNGNDGGSVVQPNLNGSDTTGLELQSPDDEADINNTETQASEVHHEAVTNASVLEEVDAVALGQTGFSNRTTSSDDLGDKENLIAMPDTVVTSDVQKTAKESVASSDIHQESDTELSDQSVAEPFVASQEGATDAPENKDSNAVTEKHIKSSAKEFDSQILQNTFMRSVKTAVTEIPLK